MTLMEAQEVEPITVAEWPVMASTISVDRWTDGNWRLSLKLSADRRRHGSAVAVVTPLDLRALADTLAHAADEIEGSR